MCFIGSQLLCLMISSVDGIGSVQTLNNIWSKAGNRARLVLIPLMVVILACSGPVFSPVSTPLLQPTELARTPLPAGIQVGGLEGIFASNASISGGQNDLCYKLYRFYEDGLALYSDFACFNGEIDSASLAAIERWFHRDNQGVASGDYFIRDQRLWIRIVEHDATHEITYLRSFQGEYCNQAFVLQEPEVKSYSGIPSALTQPVLEYNLLETTAPEMDKPGLPDPGADQCSVAGFKIISRPSIALSDNRGSFEILTNRGQECSLQYTDPAGKQIEAQGTGTITADARGICRWEWELGSLEGTGTVTITIDEITQDFSLEIR